MELDKPRRSAPSTTGDLFLCFTSNLSKSCSMRSNNGSFRGNNSAMLPPGVGSKKRGFGFESNPDPSSPKVTCIGQVRVRSKRKQRSKMNTKANAFQQQKQQDEVGGWCLQNTNQRWVHLPLTICEALKAAGSELSCFFLPCRRKSSRSSRSEERKRIGSSSSSCYGGTVLRWLAALQQGDGKAREMELVAGEEGDRGVEQSLKRRSIFDDMDLYADEICETKVPPKNALLVMRYGSDPVKVSDLSTKLCMFPIKHHDIDEEEEDDDGENEETGREKLKTISNSSSDDKEDLDNDVKILEPEGEEKDAARTTAIGQSHGSVEQSEGDHQKPQLEEKGEDTSLPNCLLLMIREPKLSMEVSKETWVSITDFIGRLPECHRQHHLKLINQSNGSDELNNTNKDNIAKSESNHLPPLPPKQEGFQPGRSSCSYPMASLIEEKLANAVAYEPLVLTRCKSEPMSSAAAKFAAPT